MKVKYLKGGVKRIVHVIAKNLKEVLDSGKKMPMIGVRLESKPDKVLLCHHCEIMGPAKIAATPKKPVPGTDGRGICVLRTTAPLKVWL